MAFAVVQRVSKAQASGATLVIAGGDGWATPTAGNLLVAVANADATVTMTTAGFTAGPSIVDGNAAYLWYKIAAGTESTITFTPGSSAPITGTVCEYSGNAASPFDASNSSTIVGSSGTTTNAAAVSSTQDGDLIVGVAALHSMSVGVPTAPGWTNGFVNQESPTSGGGSSAHVHTFYSELVAGAAGSYSTVCSWTSACSDRQHLIIAFKEAGIVVTDPGGYRQHPRHPGRRPWRAVPGMWQLQYDWTPVDNVAEVALTPVDVPVVAVALTADPQPVTLELTPCVVTLAAVAVTATPPPAEVTLTPVTVTLTGVAVVGSPVVTLTPASLALAPVAVTPVPQPVTVVLTPRTVAVTAVAVSPVPQPVTVVLIPRTVTLTPVAVTPVPQPVTVALTPAISTLSAVTLNLGGVGAVTLTPAVAALSAVALTATPGPVTVTLTPVTVTLTGRPLSPAPLPPTVALTAATLVVTPQLLGVARVALTPVTLVLDASPLGLVIAVEPGDPVVVGQADTATTATTQLTSAVAGQPLTASLDTPPTTASIRTIAPTAGVVT